MKPLILIIIFFSFIWAPSSYAWRRDSNYGAIAYSSDRNFVGYSHGANSLYAAKSRALSRCGYGCKIKVWVKDGCASLATGYDGRGWSKGYSKRNAINQAIRQCQTQTSNCRMRTYICTG